ARHRRVLDVPGPPRAVRSQGRQHRPCPCHPPPPPPPQGDVVARGWTSGCGSCGCGRSGPSCGAWCGGSPPSSSPAGGRAGPRPSSPSPWPATPPSACPVAPSRPGSRRGAEGGITEGGWPVLPCPCPRAPRDLELIAEAVERNEFLRRLGEGCPETLAQSLAPVRHGPGHTVLAEGDEGTTMYIVAEGQLSVSQRGRQLRTLGPGDVFGELAILYHCRRTATVRGEPPQPHGPPVTPSPPLTPPFSAALGPVRLWAIDRPRYRAMATSHAKQRRAEILGSLRT
uniref:Cyclic nucleotide-binding domain-containing protein n=1 Tax=Calidris pygmaea TaxID=425635 RepID=A0A8C3KBN4_9CHAR